MSSTADDGRVSASLPVVPAMAAVAGLATAALIWILGVGDKEECSAAVGAVSRGSSSIEPCTSIVWFELLAIVFLAVSLVVVARRARRASTAGVLVALVVAIALGLYLLPMVSMGLA